MAGGFVRLDSSQDWVQHCLRVATELQVVSEDVNWGKGPTHYPCLIATTMRSPVSAISCYVYRENFAELMKGDPAFVPMAMPAAPQPNIPIAQPVEQEPSSGVSYVDHFVHNAALWLTTLEIMVDTGIITQEEFTNRFARWITFVDQKMAEDRGSMSADGLFERQNKNKPAA